MSNIVKTTSNSSELKDPNLEFPDEGKAEATIGVGNIKELIDAKDGDLGYALAQQSQGLVVDSATNKRLLRKADMFICPIMCVIYAVQYMDKQTNSYASIMGLREDLHMHGNMYSWVGTALYLGYMVFEIPASLVLQHFPIGKTGGAFIVLWGFVLCMSAITHTYATFMVTRVLLGCLESVVTPCFMLMTSQWYKVEEQLFRTSLWSASAGIGAILGSLISFGLARRDPESLPMAAWRLLYIILGVITIALGIVFAIHIPDSPVKAWFLTEQDRLLTIERIRSNKQGFGNKHFKKYQFMEIFKDVRTYIYFFAIVAAEIPNGGIGTFSSIMIKNMGYKNEMALLMGAPFGGVEFVGILIVCYIAQITRQRMICAMFIYLLSILSACLLAFAPQVHAQLAGYYLQGMSIAGFICFISCVTSNTAGHTKKVVTGALCMIAYCVGNLIGPQTFITSEAPHYHSAKIVIVVAYAVCFFFAVALYVINYRENKARDERNETLDGMENSEFADLTDFENPEFRYAM